MDILTEHRDGEITVFTNNSTPEIHLTTRRAEAKEEVAENMGAVTTVADNMEDVKGAAKYAQTFDDVLLNLPTIIKAMPAAETAVKAKDDAIVAKESAQESAEKAESAVVRAEEVTAEQVELAKGYAEQAKTEVSKISSAFKIVGTVPTVEDLPKNAEVGNIYLVGDNSITNKPEYVWTSGGTWEKFGETVDLSAYQTKEEAETALAEKQDTLTAGEGIKIEGNVISTEGGKLPDNVYTQDNLIAGKNVTFTEVPPEGGIDEHTIDVFHFEEDSFSGDLFGELGNVKLGLSSGSYSSLTNGKFGKGLTGSGSNNWGFGFVFANRDLNLATPYTLDFWIKPNYSRDYVRLASNIYNWELLLPNNKLALNFGYSGIPEKTSEETLENNVWNHIALTTDGTTFITVYLNGKPCIHQEGGLNVYDGSASGVISVSAYGVVDFDEIRISDNIRYTEEFTPPTKPYTLATGPSKTAVNASVPEGIYTQSNLLGGKDIEIVPEPVEGGIDEYTLGVFHYDDSADPAKNSVEGGAQYGYGKNLNTTYYKFGVASSAGGAGILTSLSENGDWTVDAWYYCTSKYGAISQGVATSPIRNAVDSTNTLSSHLDINDSDTSQATVHIYQKTGSVKSVVIPFKMNSWFHLATERYGNTITVYKDGVPVLSYTSDDITNGGTRYLRSYGNNYDYEDELRLSAIARYKGQNFTPPTEAYHVAEPTGNMVVNFVGESGGAFDFQGTEEEFNAAVEAGKITDETVSLVTDDNSGELVATKAELSAVDRSKADTALSNVLANIDYVVESKFPTTDDPTWYRKYKSGWVEQGGVSQVIAGGATATVTLPNAMQNNLYAIVAMPIGEYRGSGEANNTIPTKTTTSFVIACGQIVAQSFSWSVCGQGAE